MPPFGCLSLRTGVILSESLPFVNKFFQKTQKTFHDVKTEGKVRNRPVLPGLLYIYQP